MAHEHKHKDHSSGERQTQNDVPVEKRVENRKWSSQERALFVVNCLLFLATLGMFIVAQQSLSVTRESVEDVQRAFLFMKDANIYGEAPAIDPNAPNKYFGFVVVDMQNSGDTPARNLQMRTSECIRQGDLPPDFSYPDLPSFEPVKRPFIAGPKSEFRSMLAVPKPLFVPARAGTKNLFVWGWMTYKDVFRRDHRTEFCLKYYGHVSGGASGEGADLFDRCPSYNCMDDDCPASWGSNPDELNCPRTLSAAAPNP
jgi:hypothetical protein